MAFVSLWIVVATISNASSSCSKKASEGKEINQTNGADEAEKAQAELIESLAKKIPADQTAFMIIVKEAQTKSASAANDMQRGGIKNDREKALCKLLKNMKVSNWIAEVEEIGANPDGLGTITLRVGSDVKILTWKFEFSDTFDNTLISPGSKIFQEASTLQKGALVAFSGNFFRSYETNECVKEGSITLEGKLKSPEFIFKFSSIKPAM